MKLVRRGPQLWAGQRHSMDILSPTQVTHGSHCIDHTVASKRPHNLVDNRAPEVLELMAASNTMVP